jgi:hypothetical protein
MGEEETDEWLTMDTVLCVVIAFFVLVIIYVLAQVTWLYLCKKQRNEMKEETRELITETNTMVCPVL